jgi:predicted metal-dependent phosphotriesterase family hydrolase
MSEFLKRLAESGVSDEDLKKMIADNPARLLGIEEKE